MKYETVDGVRTLWIHQSDLGTARMCREQLRLSLRGEYYDPDGDSAFLGTCVHEFIEFNLHHYKDHGTWPEMADLGAKVDELHQKYAAAWDTLWQHPKAGIKSLTHAIEGINRCCLMWVREVQPTIDTSTPEKWEIEGAFEVKIGEIDKSDVVPDVLQVKLRGHYDFWDGFKCMDWKTSRFREVWRKHRYDIQSSVYTYGLARKHGLSSPVDFELVSVPRDPAGNDKDGNPKYDGPQVVPLPRDSKHWEAMKREAMALANMAESMGLDTPWPLGPTDWWCSERWCSEHAQGKCLGALNPIYPDEAVHLTRLIEMGHSPERHDSAFDKA